MVITKLYFVIYTAASFFDIEEHEIQQDQISIEFCQKTVCMSVFWFVLFLQRPLG